MFSKATQGNLLASPIVDLGVSICSAYRTADLTDDQKQARSAIVVFFETYSASEAVLEYLFKDEHREGFALSLLFEKLSIAPASRILSRGLGFVDGPLVARDVCALLRSSLKRVTESPRFLEMIESLLECLTASGNCKIDVAVANIGRTKLIRTIAKVPIRLAIKEDPELVLKFLNVTIT
jgi:hypothetical protein